MEKTEYTNDIDLGLVKILALANIINRKTEMCCFAYDTAHCSYIEINLVANKKSYNKGTPAKFHIDYNKNFGGDCKDRLAEINRCIETLETVLKEKNIPLNILHPVKEYVLTHYEI